MPSAPGNFNSAQKFVRWMARRVPPTREPAFPFIFGAVCFITAWLAIPILVAFIQNHPFTHKALSATGLLGVVRGVGFVLTGAGSLIGLMLWCRGIQLCWPDYYNAHEDKHT